MKLQPERELDVSECQTISMTPVLDVTGLGTTVQEYASSKVTVWVQSYATQPRTVSLSWLSSVLNSVKVRVMEAAPVGAMIPAMSSLLP